MEPEDQRQLDMCSTILSREVLAKLRCCFCEEYLSHMPIYIYPYQNSVACGRCPVILEEDPIRNVTVETLASYLYFPCRYKVNGCLKNVALIEMKYHEERCTYKLYFCPIIPSGSCQWQGYFNELIDHYQKHHPNFVLEGTTFELDLLNTRERNYLLFYDNHLYIIYFNCDLIEDMIWWSLKYIGERDISKQYIYQIELKGKGSSTTINSPIKLIENYDCNNLNKHTAINIKTSNIREKLGDLLLVSCLILPNTLQLESVESSIAENVKDEVLFELECPVCNWYMYSPIYQCVTGHSICNSCTPSLKTCPTCQNAMSNTRNFTLEKLSSQVKLHCENKNLGCLEILSVSQYKNHIEDCKFEFNHCPFEDFLDCEWKGNSSDILQHSSIQHNDYVLETNSFIVFSLEEENTEKCYLLNACNRLFRLVFKYEDGYFYWCLQILQENDTDLFMYELDIFDNLERNQRFYLKRTCSQFLTYKQTFEESSNYVKVPYNLISPLFINGTLTYKFQVVKNTHLKCIN